MVQTERVKVDNVVLQDLLDEKFVSELKKIDLNVSLVSAIFVSKVDGKQIPIFMAHDNDKDVEARHLHIQCPDEALLKKNIRVIENFYAKKK